MSRKYDFDKPTDRRSTYSYKWDVAEGELPMWVADMDFEAPPCVKKALSERVEQGVFGYTFVPDEYFQAISDFWAARHGWRPDPKNMIFSTGVVATISSVVRKLTTPAEKVLIQSPVYNMFYNSILNNGRVVLSSDLAMREGRYYIDFADLEAKLSNPQTTLMILCNPHNPVGRIWERRELEKIGELCKKHGVTVLSDEIHCSLTDPTVPSYIPFASVNDTCRDISVTCVSVSKTFNLAGLQASAVIVSNPRLRHKVWRGINTDEVGEPSAFAMAGAIAAYREGGAWLDELRDYLYENKQYVRRFIAENLPRLSVTPSDATYLLWIDVSAYTDNSEEFAKRLRALTGLYVSDGVEYGHGGEGFIRLNTATQRANIEDGMQRLKRAIEIFESES